MYISNLLAVILCLYSTQYFHDVVALQCYNCPKHDRVDDCNVTTTCQDHEVCMLQSTMNAIQSTIEYRSQCENKNTCQTYVHAVHTVWYEGIGRKRQITQVESVGGKCLASCCTTNLCNDGCHPPPKHACNGHGMETFDDACYMFVNHEMNFIQARDYCAEHNYHLVHINSAAENAFLINKLKQLNRGPVQYWIGITDEQTENQWTFANTNGNATYFDWTPGEPDGTQGGDGNSKADCAVFDPYSGFHWRDESCSAYQVSQPICESKSVI